MGLTTITIEVGNPAKPKQTVPVEFLVDSGAIYSVVPSATLKKLGVAARTTEETFTLANGQKIKRKKVGLALDPLRRELKPLPLVLSRR